MDFGILGPLEVSAGDGAIKLGGPKQRAVLANLILRANRHVPVDLLIDGLWGEEPPESAKNTLQTYVYRLRQVLGDDRIYSEPGAYVLRADAAQIDAARFEAMVKAAKADLPSDPSKAAAAFSEALALWRGPPLADLSNEPSLQGEIARLEELHLSATEHRIATEIGLGGHSTVSPSSTRSPLGTHSANGCGPTSCSPCTGSAAKPRRSRRTSGPGRCWPTSSVPSPHGNSNASTSRSSGAIRRSASASPLRRPSD